MTSTPAEPLADGEMIEIVAEECHHASCANVPRFNPDYSRDSYPWEHCPTSAKDAWRAIARAAVAAYNPNDRLTPSNRESLGGDDLVIRLMYELHAHVPEDQRPMSMSDLSDEQAARARKAVHAVLAEWESAKAALRPDRLREALEAARESLRALMIEQPISDKRETYSDGFAQGLCYSIGRIDAALSHKD